MIEFQIGGRKTGKTTLLLEWLGEARPGERRICVFHNQDAASAAYRKAIEMKMNVDRNQFSSYDQFSKGMMRGMSDVLLGVDNLDLIINRMFDGYDVGRVTATGEDILRAPMEET